MRKNFSKHYLFNMKNLKYFIQFIFVIFFFSIFKLLGPRTSSIVGGKLFEFIGPLFRSRNIIEKNIRIVFPNKNSNEVRLLKNKWQHPTTIQ